MLGPDSKSQVTVQYENGKPVGVREIVVSHQHLVEDLTSKQVRDIVEPYVREALPKDWINGKTIWHINPTGKFYIGGPDGRNSGLTGRKIIVDTYGGAAPHGGGASLRQGPDQGRPLGRLLLRAMSPRTSWPPVLPTAARCNSLTRSAWRGRCRSISTPMAPAKCRKRSSRRPPPGDGSDAARHLAAILTSIARSMRAPRPTAISAVRPTMKAASPGRRLISSNS